MAANEKRVDRRSFLACCAGAGVASPLFSSALWSQTNGGQEPVSLEAIDHAARLAGLSFTEANREEMLTGLRANLASYSGLRALEIDQSVAPPLYFNPAVPGQRFEAEHREPRFAAPAAESRPADLEDAAFWSVARLGQLLATRELSSVELTEMYLDRIRRYDLQLQSVITLTEELALAQAKRADADIAAGRYQGALHGVPWGAKDLLAARGYRTTWGFEAYKDQVIDHDATVVRRLESSGAVLLAKLSTGEIARGDHWFGGQTRNPWKPDEGAGGSSAGPAAATAAGLVGFAIGTDTLGSILGPSRNCGLTGLRPTFGRVSRHGVMPVCWSLDKVGPMCRTAEDCAIVFSAIYGPDEQDLALVDRPFNWNAEEDVRTLRVGVLEAAFEESDSAGVNDMATLDVLRDMDVELESLALPADADMDALQMLLVDEAAAFDELILTGDVELFLQDRDAPEDMLMRVARLHPAVEYLQIQRRRMLLMQEMATTMSSVDVMVAPFGGSPVQSATSLTGHPAVSVPNGFDADGKPTAIQFIGNLYREAQALRLADGYQAETDHHRQRPALTA